MRRPSTPTPTEAHVKGCGECGQVLCPVGAQLLRMGMQDELQQHNKDTRTHRRPDV